MRLYKHRFRSDPSKWVRPNPKLTGYNAYGEPTPRLRPKVRELREWVKWMIAGKGFVTIDGILHRNCNPTVQGIRETFAYHDADVGYKWDRYFSPLPYTEEVKLTLYEEFDIKHRTPTEQRRIMEGFNEANNRRKS